MEVSTRYFWARPLETFLPGKHADVLACVTKDQIPIPDYCCRCGSSRPGSYPLKVKLTDATSAGSIAGHVLGSIGPGVEYLVRKKVAVPCCSSCLLIRRIGYVLGFFFFILGMTPFAMLAAADQATKFQTSSTTELFIVISFFLAIALGGGIGWWCSWRSLPVALYQCNGYLYLEFWSPAYQQLLLDLVPTEKAALVPGRAPGL